MIVVADSSPISHLGRIGHLEVLPQLFGQVLIPSQVAQELAHARAPEVIRALIVNPPSWIIIKEPRHIERLPELDPGEEAAISLALEEKADLLLIDEKDGREAARKLNIPITGTLGVLERAAERGYVDLREAIEKLLKTKFHLSLALAEEALRRVEPG